jgi:hypothetical protein
VQFTAVTQDDAMRLGSERAQRRIAALFRLEAECGAVLLVDVIHLAKVGGIEGAARQALEVIQPLLELLVELVRDRDPAAEQIDFSLSPTS